MRYSSLLRMADANANRALEGLRVCEDLLRFYYAQASSVKRLRVLRHAIAAQVRRFPDYPKSLVSARNSKSDLGRRFRASKPASIEQLLLINFQRAKEALRCLEECSRWLKPSLTAGFQKNRFVLYTVESNVLIQLAALRHR